MTSSRLYNSGSSSVDLSTYAVQYAAPSAAPVEDPLTGWLAAGDYYLIQEAAGSGGTQNRRHLEATGTINLAATAGQGRSDKNADSADCR